MFYLSMIQTDILFFSDMGLSFGFDKLFLWPPIFVHKHDLNQETIIWTGNYSEVGMGSSVANNNKKTYHKLWGLRVSLTQLLGYFKKDWSILQ